MYGLVYSELSYKWIPTVYDHVRLHNISGYCDICYDLISQEAEAE